MEKLHDGAKWIFFFQYLGIFVLVFYFIFIFVFPFVYLFGVREVLENATITVFTIPLATLAKVFGGLLIFAMIFAYVFAILAYNNYRYEFREDSLYVQRGVIWKHYSSIPYGRIQNVDIKRGIIARLCGFSSLLIETAGYASWRSGRVEGDIPAIEREKAEKYREWLLRVIKGKKQGV